MNSVTSIVRKPYKFKGEDDGFASIAEFVTTNNNNYKCNNNIINNQQNVNYNQNQQQQQQQGYIMRRKNSLRNISSSFSNSTMSCCSPRSAQPHFLESCALCRKSIAGNCDIFMYRGDTPFCSEECRQDQIEIDEAKEKNWNLKSLRTKKESVKKTQDYSFRTSTVAAA